MKTRLIKFMLRVECAMHMVDAYLYAQRGMEKEYRDARDRASQAEFKLHWG